MLWNCFYDKFFINSTYVAYYILFFSLCKKPVNLEQGCFSTKKWLITLIFSLAVTNV